MPRTRPPLPVYAVTLLAAFAVAAALLLTGEGHRRSGGPAQASNDGLESATGFAGAALPAAQPAREFALVDEQGRRVSLGEFRGRVVVLAFLSTACAPACVLIAQQIRGALDELARPVPVLLVSAQGGADTPARVAGFLQSVSLAGRARFLSGSPAQLRAVWRAYGVAPLSSGRAAFERDATVRLLDARGRERVLFGLEQLTPEGVAHDIRKLSGCAGRC
jgi:protein SCO1/2